MIRVYIGETIDCLPHLQLLFPNFGFPQNESYRFMNNAFINLTRPFFEIVDRVEEADIILVPHNYYSICERSQYLSKYNDLAKRHNKKILVIAYGDGVDKVRLHNVIVLRSSAYRSERDSNEIILPPATEDFCINGRPEYRSKTKKVKIGFCGWSNFDSTKKKIKYLVKKINWKCSELFFDLPTYHRQGIWFRQKAISVFQKSDKAETDFLIRKTFSGSPKTIELKPEIARKEYIENVKNSDFTLCVRGDGNFSLRFFEVLSLGRIPLFVDTDCVLPLEEIINYDDFIVRVDYKDISKIDEIAANYYNTLSPEEFLKKQEMAREVFEKYLRIDKFFEYFFENKIKEYL